jgi:hypothetical protein
MKSIERIHLVVISVLVFVAQSAAADCQPFMETISGYEREVKEAMHDEPEDLPKELSRYEKARQSNYTTEQAERIEKKIRAGYLGMKMIKPPASVTKLHADMVDYYKSGVAMLDAIERDDAEDRRAAELATWVGLKKYFLNIRVLFVKHDCNMGDVEAIDAHYLPMLDETIEGLRRGTAAPSTY